MQSYDTMVEALNDLNKRGYKYDFNIVNNNLHCKSINQSFLLDKFNVVEYHRFEGVSDPGDLSEIYVIETDTGIKGVLTDGYGISSTLPPSIIKKLSQIHNSK